MMMLATATPVIGEAGGMIAQSIQERQGAQGKPAHREGAQEQQGANGPQEQPGQPGANGHSPAETSQATKTESSNQAFTSGMQAANQQHLDGISGRF